MLEKLGSGGMGVVYKAEDTKLHRFVALKFLSGGLTDDDQTLERFRREAQAASSLNHHNICTIYEIGENEGQPFIAMEFLEGETLAQRAVGGPLKIDALLDLGIQIADGLEAAHNRGIIHRDIKPANIFVSTRGHAKILDFGLAKVISRTSQHAASLGATSGEWNSSTGSALGTVSYMSPEQALGKPLDTRTDLFSLGVVLYEMASGREPFQGDTDATVFDAILHRAPVSPVRLNPDIPIKLEEIINKCLEKNRELRYQHASDVATDLKRLKRDSDSQRHAVLPAEEEDLYTTAPPPTTKPSGDRPSASGQSREATSQPNGTLTLPVIPVKSRGLLKWLPWVVVGLGLAVGGWVVLTRHTKPTNETAESPLTVRPVENFPGQKQLPIFSRDGNSVAFAWDGGEQGQNSDVYLMQLEGGKPLRITSHPASEWPGCFSPDGRRLYFNRQSESGFASYWVPTLGGDETWVTDGIVSDISPDGQWAAVVRPSGSVSKQFGVFVRNLATGAEHRLGENLGTMNPANPGTMNPQFSPDGKWVYVPYGLTQDSLSVHRVPVEGGKLERVEFPSLGADIDRVTAVEFASRGSRMLIEARQKDTNVLLSFVANADGSEPKRLPRSVAPGALSPDGRQMVSVHNAFVVTVYRVEAFPLRGRPAIPQKVLETGHEEYSPKISPDGSRILLSSNRKGRWEIWLWNIEMTDGHPIFSRGGGTAGSPDWSPDGKWIAFDARAESASAEIWTVASAAGEPKILVNGVGENMAPCFDPSSQWVYFTSSRTGSLQLFREPVTGGQATQVTQGGGFTCQFSEDGRYIYYLKTRSGGEIWRLEVASNREEPVVPEMKSRNWKVLSDGIYLLDSQNNSQLGTAARVGDARFYRFATKKIEDLGFRTPKAASFIGIDLSQDRKWLYYGEHDSLTSELYLVENLP
jgi:serine/threonine protein kinase